MTCMFCLLLLAPVLAQADGVDPLQRASPSLGWTSSPSIAIPNPYAPYASQGTGSYRGGAGELPRIDAYGMRGGGRTRALRPSQRKGTRASMGPSYVAPGSRLDGATETADAGRAAAAFGLLPVLTGAAGRSAAGSYGSGAPAANGPSTSKWDLSATTSVPGVPSLLLQSVSGGPLTKQEAQALVQLLTGSSATEVDGLGSGSDAPPMLLGGVDPDLLALQSELDALQPIKTSSTAIDGDVLRGWFRTLDSSSDAAVSFLEWRDRTALPLDLFRRIDESGEGLLSFEEFSRAMILNASGGGGRTVDPELVQWAVSRGEEDENATDAGSSATPEAIEALSSQELMQRARNELSAATMIVRDPRVNDGAKGDKDSGAGAKPDAAGARTLSTRKTEPKKPSARLPPMPQPQPPKPTKNGNGGY